MSGPSLRPGAAVWPGLAISMASRATSRVRENLLAPSGCAAARRPTIAWTTPWLAFDLAALAHRPVRTLSAGQRRRTALARVVLAQAPLWLLDEPLNALDAPAQAAFRTACRSISPPVAWPSPPLMPISACRAHARSSSRHERLHRPRRARPAAVWRRPGDVAVVLAFFVVATVLFPLGIGPQANVLARIAAGVLWCAALFASMLSLDRLFAADYEDGTLDLLLLAPWPLELAALAKCPLTGL